MAYSRIEQAYLDGLVQAQFPDPVEPEPTLLASADTGITTDGGAYVGTRLNMPKGLNTPENMQAVGNDIPKTVAGVAKGMAQGFVGLPGDLEGIGRLVLNYMGADVNEQTKLPTTQDVKGFLDQYIKLPELQTGDMSNFETAGEWLAPGGQLKAVKPVAKAIKGAVKMTEGLPVGLSIKDVSKAVDTPQFKNWFGDWKEAPDMASKVVDENGAPLAVYHGTGRPDRIDANFRKSRATSGPMSFFTDNPEVASGYAKGKTDTSLVYDDNAYDYNNWFKKKEGRSTLNLEQAGRRMTLEESQSALDKLRDIKIDEDTGEVIYQKGGGSIMDKKSFDYYLQNEAKGNPLVLANKLFLESGTLYDQEEKFAKVLNLMGVKGFEMKSPHDSNPAIYKVYLNIKNPLDTSAIPEEVMANLEKAASRVRKPTQSGGADNWDKNTVDPQEWINRLKSDQKDGTTHAWVSIPDWVTKSLKADGFDGIKDAGGKSGGSNHSVWIPFDETQVKSATGNRGTFDPNKKNILHGVGVGGAGATTQQNQEKK